MLNFVDLRSELEIDFILNFVNLAVELTLTSEICLLSFLFISIKVFSISGVLFFVLRSLTILVTRAESSSEIFCLRFDHMVAIPMINTGLMNKKTVVKVKKGMTPEELSNDKLDMIRRSNFIEILLVDQVF